tara:strand:- start:14 stop:1006 length:993 start_codon:yes stop_codon:yes gene_type:complete
MMLTMPVNLIKARVDAKLAYGVLKRCNMLFDAGYVISEPDHFSFKLSIPYSWMRKVWGMITASSSSTNWLASQGVDAVSISVTPDTGSLELALFKGGEMVKNVTEEFQTIMRFGPVGDDETLVLLVEFLLNMADGFTCKKEFQFREEIERIMKETKAAERMEKAFVFHTSSHDYTLQGGRIIRAEKKEGKKIVFHFEGRWGEERVVRYEIPDDEHTFYFTGDKEREMLVRIESSNMVRHFETKNGKSALVRIDRNNNIDGPEGEAGVERVERVVSMEMKDGNKYFFKGSRSEENIVKREFPTGGMRYYDSYGNISCDEFPDGKVVYYCVR